MNDLPCIPSEHLGPLVSKINASPLIRETKEGRLIGLVRDYEPNYARLVPDLNPEQAASFPMLYHLLSASFFSIGRNPLFPAELALPAICLDGPIKTLLPVTYLDLSTGNLTFSAPEKMCVQFHIHNRGNTDILFS